MNKISGLVVAHNEEKNLSECLDSLGFCDEIVVVLDKCTDGSALIARQYNAKIVSGNWDIEGERRNIGINNCSCDWVIELDCDERVPKELAHEIKSVVNTSSYHVHHILFHNYVGTVLVKYGWGCYFGKSKAPVLFKKEAKQWGMQRVHPVLKLSNKIGPILNNHINHHVDDDISDMMDRLNRYTSLNAMDIADKKTETFAKNIRRIFSRFFKCFVIRKGYKEGKYGFMVALCAGLYPIISYIKAKTK